MKKLWTLTIMSLVLLTAACAKKNDDGAVSKARSVRVAANGTGSTQSLPMGTGYMQGTTGRVYADQAYTDQFNNAVKALVSASMDPSKLGTVDPYDGVRFSGFIAFNSNGTLNFAGSRLKLEIWDDIAVSGEDLPVTISFKTMTQGAVKNTGEATLLFEDAYGSIKFVGQISGNAFYGKASYVNKKHFDGKTKPFSGDLGDFEIASCGLFNCQ
jgi:hypothetical protein